MELGQRRMNMGPTSYARIALLGLLPLLSPVAAVAETAYVTDQLQLGLHQAADTSDRAFRTLQSGQEMEVLSGDRNYSSVRLPDGTSGWVKTRYLIDDKPASLIVAETQAARDALAAELEETRRAFAAPAETIDALQADAATFDAELSTANSRIQELEQENKSIQGLKEQYRGSLPISWVAVAIGVCLVAGFLFGIWWVDRRSRMRHGGIRIY